MAARAQTVNRYAGVQRVRRNDDGDIGPRLCQQDLLQHLIDAGLDDERIRDQMLTLLIAGHDTSTALLAWTFYLLGSHPEIYRHLVTDVRTALGAKPPGVSSGWQPPLLDQVIKESLRLYPPIHIGNRRVAEPVEFSEGSIPAGERMFYSIYLTHRDPAIWESAEEFCPARFAHGRKTPPFAYVPFGGGPGMVLKPEPIFEAVETLAREQTRVILLSPSGRVFNQAIARELASQPDLLLVCGHYEGFDERIRQQLADDELSIGDYVLTNGALPAMVIIDAVTRLLPGALGDDASAQDESFSQGLLEYPQYTRPREFRGMSVPEVLLSGDHGKIAEWRHEQREALTRSRRPDRALTVQAQE